jgi:dihydroflavonol-4-reductase
MRILVTGGTGFVGSHAVAALTRGGHDVRLLVRRPEQVSASLSALRVDVADVAVGDVLDADAVSLAVEGCAAVVHAAAIFSLDPRRAEEMRRTNVRATELVLDSAAERGLTPVVHVSTTVALIRRAAARRTCRWAISTVPTLSRKSSRRRSPVGCRMPAHRW